MRALGAVVTLLFFRAAFTPAVELVGAWLSPDRPPERADAIVVLGVVGVAAGGGLTDASLRTEADVRAELARASGVPAAAILTLTTARTTHEEALRMQTMLQPRRIRKILLVGDGPGMLRAVAVFKRVGFEVVPAPQGAVGDFEGSPEDRLSLLRQIATELIAPVYYRAMGYL